MLSPLESSRPSSTETVAHLPRLRRTDASEEQRGPAGSAPGTPAVGPGARRSARKAGAEGGGAEERGGGGAPLGVRARWDRRSCRSAVRCRAAPPHGLPLARCRPGGRRRRRGGGGGGVRGRGGALPGLGLAAAARRAGADSGGTPSLPPHRRTTPRPPPSCATRRAPRSRAARCCAPPGRRCQVRDALVIQPGEAVGQSPRTRSGSPRRR